MSTANKNYPLIKETDSTGNPLNAYDQLVTESNNFRRAVDKDINEVENSVGDVNDRLQQTNNRVSSLEQNVTQSGAVTIPEVTANQTANFTVNFQKAYNSFPTVVATINSNFPSAKRFVTVSQLTTNKFQLNLYSENDATNLMVQWIANGY